ncbi:hypothetical protein HPB48_016889 [Haemaphysalis longicornis]|uniref:Uncharacterized protein n=1 Tax=Haemaphysalis longicornis TaxID=44386 RepID=A0A9J6GS83_HAELO|nr:hypothetical protein HPB48_016889 [Haemaphysalis longicornis]
MEAEEAQTSETSTQPPVEEQKELTYGETIILAALKRMEDRLNTLETKHEKYSARVAAIEVGMKFTLLKKERTSRIKEAISKRRGRLHTSANEDNSPSSTLYMFSFFSRKTSVVSNARVVYTSLVPPSLHWLIIMNLSCPYLEEETTNLARHPHPTNNSRLTERISESTEHVKEHCATLARNQWKLICNAINGTLNQKRTWHILVKLLGIHPAPVPTLEKHYCLLGSDALATQLRDLYIPPALPSIFTPPNENSMRRSPSGISSGRQKNQSGSWSQMIPTGAWLPDTRHLPPLASPPQQMPAVQDTLGAQRAAARLNSASSSSRLLRCYSKPQLRVALQAEGCEARRRLVSFTLPRGVAQHYVRYGSTSDSWISEQLVVDAWTTYIRAAETRRGELFAAVAATSASC